MGNKQFKDPIYGYIEINSEIVSQIIDTPTFQRLKDIRQTSYTPLYPAAYHNRYVHSLGVYYLGRIAFNSIKPQLLSESENLKIKDNIDCWQNIFELACLLHDVGHAPFSHTGENFFLDKKNTLYETLKNTIGDEDFSIDFDALGAKKPAAHECMSCIVAIKSFPKFFNTIFDKNLFARCIIGMNFRFKEKYPEYTEDMNVTERQEVTKQRENYQNKKKTSELLNCIIDLLNSSIIDVDRLDYIIRDAITIGFKSIDVDYMRLLNGLRIVSFDKVLRIGYHKSALSVIESAIYAHDAEKKWIQGHPAILYEMETLKNAMNVLTKQFSSKDDENPLFCYESLTEEGKKLYITVPLLSEYAKANLKENIFLTSQAIELQNAGVLFDDQFKINIENSTIDREYHISLLADEDFLYLMKSFCKDDLGYEYFARNRRRSAVWKSEAEFRAIFQERFGDDSKDINIFEKDFSDLMDFCQKKTGAPIVTEDTFRFLDEEEANAEDAIKNCQIDQELYDDIIRGIANKRYWTNILKEVSASLDIDFEFLIISQKKFNSSFKETIGEIPIIFPNLDDKVVLLKNVVDVLKSSSDKKSNFFHLFYKSNLLDENTKRKVVNTIAKALIDGISKKT